MEGQVGKVHTDEVDPALFQNIKVGCAFLGRVLENLAHAVDCEEHDALQARNLAADVAHVLTELTVAFVGLQVGKPGATVIKAMEDFQNGLVERYSEDI